MNISTKSSVSPPLSPTIDFPVSTSEKSGNDRDPFDSSNLSVPGSVLSHPDIMQQAQMAAVNTAKVFFMGIIPFLLSNFSDRY
ncbi:MAG: hypothetical protein LBR74_06510 [Eubacterium sp.]|nr:hypothetical protein [Eubacterium sp.]